MNDFLQKLKALGRREQGFTLAELLVGLLIFGVLASIAVPMFINQRNSAKDSELRADLANASINLENSKPDNGGRYPETLPDDIVIGVDGAELKYTFPYDRMDYCLQIIAGDKTLFKSNNDMEATTTDCTYEYVVPATKLSGQMSGYKPVLTWRTVAAATQYVIYKNNIPVQTVNVPSSATVTSTSYTLPAMAPEEFATFYIVVMDGATASPQSNTVGLTAPVPPPAAPVLKIASSDVKSSTMQQYTLQWGAVKYTDVYELWDTTATPVLIKGDISGSSITYQLDKQRGTTTRVVLRAKNTEGSSPDSNEVALTTAWPASSLISGTSNVTDASINFVFQTVNGTTRTPDWGTGTPNSSIRLKVVESGTGALVFDQSGITTPTFRPTKAFNRVNHTATVIVTTSTGQVLGESAPITITFPKPSAPAAVVGLKGIEGGTASITPNRLTWNAVTCVSSTPEYFISHDAAQNGNRNSGWITGTIWDIPQAYLAQGNAESFDIIARCVNANGTSSNGPSVTTTFTTGILPPSTPTGLTAANRGSTISWAAATCAVGTTTEYSISQTVKNSTNVTNTYTTTNTSYPLAGLTPGTNQTVDVSARCVQYAADGVTVTAGSSFSAPTTAYTWTTPLPVPAAPTLTLTSKTISSATEASYQISWNTVSWAQTYQIFNADNPASPIATTGINTTTTTIKVPRGTTMNVYVKSVNTDATSVASNTVALADTWPTPVILSTTTYPYDGKIYIKWQNGTDTAPTPDWGTPGYKVKVNVFNAKTGITKTYTDIAAREFTTPDGFPREDHTVRIYVTTSTGVELPSNSVTVTFPPPGPPAPVTGLVSSSAGAGAITANRLVWNAVSCGTSTPEYLVTNTDGSGNSGWVTGTVSGSTVYYDLPQGWLKQGFNEAFTVAARCVNPNGPSPASTDVSTNFNASVLTPAAVTGVTNNGVDNVSWTHSTAPTGLSREYKVVYITKNGVASTESFTTANSTYTLSGLSPDTIQKVYVQVRFYNPVNSISSAWSAMAAGNTTQWTTPRPVPAAPVITLDSSAEISATHQRYTISWPAVQWASNYRLVDSDNGSFLKDAIAGTATSTTIDLPRGAAAENVALRAYNASGSSPNSNVVVLSAPWPTPAITTVTTQRAGSATFVWQSGTYPDYTPDWGTPGYKVDLEVRKDTTSGAVAYTATALTTPSHNSTVFAGTTALRGVTNYYAKITVTTSNGDVLTSSWKNFLFETPAIPARATNFRSDAGGPGTIKNDRLLWDAITCATSGSTPQYYVGRVTPGTTTDISTLVSWKDQTSVIIPQADLSAVQNGKIAYRLLTRCIFPEGDYSSWNSAIINGAGYHEFTVGIAPPTTNPGTPTRVDATSNTVSWSAAVCATGFSPAYTLNKPIHNGVASTTTQYTTSATSYDLPSITAGTNQSVQVAAKCVSDTDGTKMSANGAYSAAYAYRAPLAKPAAPVITKGTTSMTTSTTATVNISWGAVANAEYYDVFNADTGAKITTVASPGTTTGILVNRGSTGNINVNVKAGNFTFASTLNTASNTLGLNAPWPAAAILSATSNDQKQITVKWQNSDTDPDWGNPDDRITVYAEQPAGTLIYTSPVQSGQSLTFGVTNAVNTDVYIKVTTANGEVLTSPKTTVNFIMPAKPAVVTNLTATATGTGAISPDRLTWTGVTCTVAGSTPQYFVRQFVAGGGTATEKNISGWTVTTASYTIPQSWLTQGDVYTYEVFARCVNGNGQSAYDPAVRVTAARTNVLPPAAPANFRVVDNSASGAATLSWDTVTCASGFTAGYAVYFTSKNGAASTDVIQAGTDNTVVVTGLTPNTSHTAYVKARCYNAADDTITSSWTAAPASANATWTTPIPVPVAPVLTFTQTADNNLQGTTSNDIKWNAVTWATSYTLYDASNDTGLYTGSGTTFSITIPKNTSRSFYVVASNASGSGAASNTVVVSPKYATPVINRTAIDDFTLRASFWFQDRESTWGTGSTAKMISTGYGTYDVTSPDSFAKTNHIRADKDWYLEVTTVTGAVITSAPVTISPKPLPNLVLTHSAQLQRLNYDMSNTPSLYGLDATNSSWKVEVSDTTAFTKTYPQSAASGTDPNTTSVAKTMPTHGNTYFARYIITRTSDGAQIVSAVQSVLTPTKQLDRTHDGARDLVTIDTTPGTSSKLSFTQMYNAGNLYLTAPGNYTDPRIVGTDCIIMPILDYTAPGSQGVMCWAKNLNSGSLYYYNINSNGTLDAPTLEGSGWNMYSEVVVVQNFWGDDRPALWGIRASDGGLETWRTGAGGSITSTGADRSSGAGWGPTNASSIDAIRPVYDFNGYGSVGIVSVSINSPWTRYYDSRMVPTNTGAQNIVAGVSLLTSWNSVVGSTAGFPTTASPASKGSYVYSRDYGSVVIGGKVLPVIGFGPINYLDVFIGNGAGSWGSKALNWGYPNDSSIRYPGQNDTIG